jgi:hypothetical protein
MQHGLSNMLEHALVSPAAARRSTRLQPVALLRLASNGSVGRWSNWIRVRAHERIEERVGGDLGARQVVHQAIARRLRGLRHGVLERAPRHLCICMHGRARDLRTRDANGQAAEEFLGSRGRHAAASGIAKCRVHQGNKLILGDFNCRAADDDWHAPALLARSSCSVAMCGLPTGIRPPFMVTDGWCWGCSAWGPPGSWAAEHRRSGCL